jgi:hypothetical protein
VEGKKLMEKLIGIKIYILQVSDWQICTRTVETECKDRNVCCLRFVTESSIRSSFKLKQGYVAYWLVGKWQVGLKHVGAFCYNLLAIKGRNVCM